MKKSLMTASAALAVFAMAFAAAAQDGRNVTTSKESADTVKLHVSGGLVLDYVWRAKEFSQSGLFPTVDSGPRPSDENDFEGEFYVRFDAVLNEKVSAVVELGKRRTITPSGIDRMGTYGLSEYIQLREAQIKFDELFDPGLSAKVGITTWGFDVRGKGHAFALGPRRSQSFAKNFDVVEAIELLDNDPVELTPVGLQVSFTRGLFTADLVLVPGLVEQGEIDRDETLYALDVWYNLKDIVGNDKSRVGLVAALVNYPEGPLGDGAAHAAVWTFGIGVNLVDVGVPGLELFGEFYFQTGKAGEVADDDADAKGMAFQIGAEYHVDNPMKPWVGINYTMVSGDGDDAGDTDCDRFLSYENVSDLLILEDMYFGFDVDSNYTAIKISAGVTPIEKLEISAILGICKTAEKINYGGGNEEDKLGNELDIKVKYDFSKQVSVSAAYARLMGSDILEMETGGPGNPDSEDTTQLYTIGVNLKF